MKSQSRQADWNHLTRPIQWLKQRLYEQSWFLAKFEAEVLKCDQIWGAGFEL